MKTGSISAIAFVITVVAACGGTNTSGGQDFLGDAGGAPPPTTPSDSGSEGGGLGNGTGNGSSSGGGGGGGGGSSSGGSSSSGSSSGSTSSSSGGADAGGSACGNCTTDSDCSACPSNPNGIQCCDTTSHMCYPTTLSVCPRPHDAGRE